MNKKKEIRKEIRRKLKDRSTDKDVIPQLKTMSEKDFFMLNTNNLWRLDKAKNGVMNATRSSIQESIIRDSTLYSEIQRRRKQENTIKEKEKLSKAKKETAKLIKKALAEQGWTEAEVTKKRDEELEIDVVYHAFDIAKQILGGKLKVYLETLPIYTNWLEPLRGMSILLSSKLLRIVNDIERFEKPSSLWHYFGLHVDENGKAPKMRHGQQCTWNPIARALTYQIAESLVKSNSPLREYYDNYKKRDTQNHPDYAKFYLDSRAKRYLAKMFLLEFWLASYRAKGLEPPSKPYSSRYHPDEPFQPKFPY